MYSMWQTEDVQAKRMKGATQEEMDRASKCGLCGKTTITNCKTWHLLGHCAEVNIREAREGVLIAVDAVLEKSRISKNLRAIIRLPWVMNTRGQLLDFEKTEVVKAAVMHQNREKVKILRKVVRAGAAEGGTEIKLAMEARQMIYKGMMGSEWDVAMVSLGLKAEVAVNLRRKLPVACTDATCDIWRARNKEIRKLNLAKSMRDNPEADELVNAAIQAKEHDSRRSRKPWCGEIRIRRQDPSAQLRWAKRTLQECRRNHESRADCNENREKLREMDAMGSSLRKWLGLDDGHGSAEQWRHKIAEQADALAKEVAGCIPTVDDSADEGSDAEESCAVACLRSDTTTTPRPATSHQSITMQPPRKRRSMPKCALVSAPSRRTRSEFGQHTTLCTITQCVCSAPTHHRSRTQPRSGG